MSDPAAIVAEGLTKRYRRVVALADLDLEVPRGEIFGFLGPNGSGKTTTIRTMLDEIRPTAGRASIVGLDSRRDSVEIRRHIGYVPGDLALWPDLTGHDTLRFLANLRGGVDWSHVEDLAARLGADLARKVGDLSSGNRQKIGLIQAFMNRPEVLVLDEPSSGLDPLVQREFQAMLREAAAGGSAVFLSSHTLSEVQRVADRVGIIRGGRLVAVERLEELRHHALRRVELELSPPIEPAALARVPGVSEVTADNHRVVLSFAGPMSVLLEAVGPHHQVLDIATRDADLEEIFLTYYREDASGDRPGVAQRP